ncbi:hypothetical protein A0128_13170 [Leptospira tipperaryensis]|uniref:Uncharacterized protein n=1 Tax=Leptospira tipperaryensis TaxID=2564040 RepID=A0A1D7UYP7_9LEPT|nr:hypothetical protein A0128_13170 [Leptospira tipperaryensis]
MKRSHLLRTTFNPSELLQKSFLSIILISRILFLNGLQIETKEKNKTKKKIRFVSLYVRILRSEKKSFFRAEENYESGQRS